MEKTTALEHVRRMRGGAQSHLMRCDDGHFYVVKFQNNPQADTAGGRILVNEWLGTRVAARMGLPVPPCKLVEVPAALIAHTPDLCIQLPSRREPCRPGLQFGSLYPGHPAYAVVLDLLPDEQLRAVTNIETFVGVLVADKFLCNCDGRQAIFHPDAAGGYSVRFIDFGFMANAGFWKFPDAPLRGLFARHSVYVGVHGMETFAPWLERVGRLDSSVIGALADEIPPEWYQDERAALEQLIEQLARRRPLVRQMILDAKNSSRQPFVNWRES
jgi:hypothetical protein